MDPGISIQRSGRPITAAKNPIIRGTKRRIEIFPARGVTEFLEKCFTKKISPGVGGCKSIAN